MKSMVLTFYIQPFLFLCLISQIQYFKSFDLFANVSDERRGSTKIKCEICGKQYSSASNKRKHVREHHENNPPKGSYWCHHCGKDYDKRYRLNEHIKDTHTNSRFTCPKCGKPFNQRRNMLRHVISFTL